MKRKKFLGIAGSTAVIAGVTYYLLSDTKNFERGGNAQIIKTNIPLKQAEREILLLASLAPSGHNAQPWRVKYIKNRLFKNYPAPVSLRRSVDRFLTT